MFRLLVAHPVKVNCNSDTSYLASSLGNIICWSILFNNGYLKTMIPRKDICMMIDISLQRPRCASAITQYSIRCCDNNELRLASSPKRRSCIFSDVA
jgi:hypothetical protein